MRHSICKMKYATNEIRRQMVKMDVTWHKKCLLCHIKMKEKSHGEENVKLAAVKMCTNALIRWT